ARPQARPTATRARPTPASGSPTTPQGEARAGRPTATRRTSAARATCAARRRRRASVADRLIRLLRGARVGRGAPVRHLRPPPSPSPPAPTLFAPRPPSPTSLFLPPH